MEDVFSCIDAQFIPVQGLYCLSRHFMLFQNFTNIVDFNAFAFVTRSLIRDDVWLNGACKAPI